jgi:hypothetical protein
MASYIHRIHLNRPKKTRLIIAVRFVVTAAVSHVSTELDTQAPMPHSAGSTDVSLVSREQRYRSDSREAATAGVRGTVAMRLRLVGPEEPTMKEYHHAESLPA